MAPADSKRKGQYKEQRSTEDVLICVFDINLEILQHGWETY